MRLSEQEIKSSSMIKVAAIGECMVEMQPLGDGMYRRAYAGDTFNMAQYLAWLGADQGIQVSYVTVLGQDKFGREMLEAWEENGLDTSLVMTSPVDHTGLYIADVDDQGNRDYVFYRLNSAARKLFHQIDSNKILSQVLNCHMIYVSAITMMILSDQDRQRMVDIFALAREKGIQTVFDTNYRASGWKSPAEAALWITTIMAHTDIVLPTNDENRQMFGDSDDQATLERFKLLGINEIVVKCGNKECLIWDRNDQISVPAIQGIDVVDTTSAGDSFNAAYLCGRLKGLTPQQAAKNGHRLAAEVIQHRGAIIPKNKVTDLNLMK
jgi:2-dehydro-3-deoxygluconokinase